MFSFYLCIRIRCPPYSSLFPYTTLFRSDLAVRSAKTGRAGRPEVVGIAEAEDLLRRKQLQGLRPDVVGLVVARMDGRDELRAVEPEHLGEKLPAPLDRFFLAVIADREVAEHLEECLVIRVLPHL